MPAAAKTLLPARADLASCPVTSCSWTGLIARRSRPVIGSGFIAHRGDGCRARRGVARSIAGGARSRTCRRYLCRPAERIVDFADRAAARFKTDKPESESAEHVPECKIEKARNQRIERRLWL